MKSTWITVAVSLLAAVGVGSIIRDLISRYWGRKDKASTDNAEIKKAEIASADSMNNTLWAQVQRTQGHVEAVQAQIFSVITENGELKFRLRNVENDNTTCHSELAELKLTLSRIHARSAPLEETAS